MGAAGTPPTDLRRDDETHEAIVENTVSATKEMLSVKAKPVGYLRQFDGALT